MNLVEKEHDIWDKHDPRNLCTRPPHVESPCNGYPRADCPGYKEKSVPISWDYNLDPKTEPSIGIDPDYDKIEPKAFDPTDLVKKLNTESYDKRKFKITHSESWDWSIDTVAHRADGYNLLYDNVKIGYLELDDSEDNTGLFVNMIPSMDCTVYQIKYIRECTGWN